MHKFKRFFLLFGILCAICIPLFTVQTNVVLPIYELDETGHTLTSHTIESAPDDKKNSNLIFWIWAIYLLGSAVMLGRFTSNLHGIYRRIAKNDNTPDQEFTQVLHTENLSPHTFFRYIFLNKFDWDAKRIPKAVLQHEQAHAYERHSLDVMLLELLQIIYWFNPLIYLFRSAVLLNHEFLADAAVLRNTKDRRQYQYTLLGISTKSCQPTLANYFNYPSIRKRIVAMNTKTGLVRRRIKSFLLLPMTSLLLFSFVDRHEVYIESDKQIKVTPAEMKPASKEAAIETPLLIEPIRATPAEIAEYNKLAQKYNRQEQGSTRYYFKEVKRLKALYKLMSLSQRQNAEPFPVLPEEPPAPPEPPSPVKVPPAPPKPPSPVDAPPAPPEPPAFQHPPYGLDYNLSKLTGGYKEMHARLLRINKRLQEQYQKKGLKQDLKFYEELKDLQQKMKKEVSFLQSLQNKLPPSKDPVHQIKEMEKKGATFMSEGKEINAAKALEIMKKSKNLSVETESSNGATPIVTISNKGKTHPKK